ncbi:YraN family protein [Streptomyces bohaiensis]|uniref:UPF0102 protein HCN52_02790 n=1 Tax=Streptomyces bohaiensis TaxID=1431344 RepID=A0ABX1C3U5_9ACTN|nr:YraN family protein [Streptomyces bohaiensis]NJQ13896.1 YraN family protein [Streptomyces bohaiensis]
MNRRRALGRYGEQVAARLLEQSGLTVIDRNWRCRSGEIDIVARGTDVDTAGRRPRDPAAAVVVCEVKTRTAGGPQHPMAGLGPRQLDRLRWLAEEWLAARWLPRYGGPPAGGVRIDLVGVLVPRRGPAVVEHARGVG